MTDTQEMLLSNYGHTSLSKNYYVFGDYGAVLEDGKHRFLVFVIWFFSLLAMLLSLPKQLTKLIGLVAQNQLEKIRDYNRQFYNL